MNGSRTKLAILVISLTVFLFITVFLSLELYRIQKQKDISLINFTTLVNNLIENDIFIFISKMHTNDLYMSNLTAFRLNDSKNEPLYIYASREFNSEYINTVLFSNSYSLFLDYYNKDIKISGVTYNIEAVFNLTSKMQSFVFFVKISILLFCYLVVLIILLLLRKTNSITRFSPVENTTVKISSTSSFTGIKNPEKKITDELKKSAAFDHDIVLALVSSPTNQVNDNTDEFERVLQSHFPFHDLVFPLNKDTFCILLPNTDLESGIKQIESFDQYFVSISSKTLKFPIMFGLSSRNGRLISGKIIIKEAKAALHKAMNEKDYPIIGFRPNPAKYREYLSKFGSRL
jgi:hypothetical protein